jgi:hypothetical protein
VRALVVAVAVAALSLVACGHYGPPRRPEPPRPVPVVIAPAPAPEAPESEKCEAPAP